MKGWPGYQRKFCRESDVSPAPRRQLQLRVESSAPHRQRRPDARRAPRPPAAVSASCQQMAQRKEWLSEERGQLDRVERAMLELKALAAPYIAVGRRDVIEPIELLAEEEGQLRKERLKGIPEPDVSQKDAAWLQRRVDELWEEKLAFGHRRGRWEALIEGCERELSRAQDLGPPDRPALPEAEVLPPPPAAAAPASAAAAAEADLDDGLDLSPPASPNAAAAAVVALDDDI
eukprot:TRINITY_DN17185_c0_g1_i2.p1 TRINITY_DN17185_c0_g1~~TRINITY_DN17185_c0_g1_i2.p1  ORF type:complete len:232 (+),score=60.86 TRINITY_DN17185_c0_g1_i2:583-1278(+)